VGDEGSGGPREEDQGAELRIELGLVLSDATNHYFYGPNASPVEQINLTNSTPTYLTYTPSDSAWVSTNQAGDQTGYDAYDAYDAYDTLATGTPQSPFGYSSQYADAMLLLSIMGGVGLSPADEKKG
jgi:hypothetical protein